MATVTTPSRRPTTLVEAHRRIRHPLQRLRGYIRGYVAAEGLCLLLSMLAVWFWAGLLLDYAPFGLFDTDWVESVPAWGRALFLGTLFVGVVAVIYSGIFTRVVWLVGGIAAGLGALLGFTVGFFVSGVAAGLLTAALLGAVLGGFGMMLVSVFTLALREGGWSVAAAGVFLLYLLVWFLLALAFAFSPLLGLVGLIFWLMVAGVALGFGLWGCDLRGKAPWLVGLLWAVAGGCLGLVMGGGLADGFAALVGAVLLGGAGALILGSLGVMATARARLPLRKDSYGLVAIPLVVLYLSAWCIVGALSTVVPGWITGILVLLVITVPVAAAAAKRLFYDFSDQQLALVLERRYPRVLGDRLITAVELSDPPEAARLGYSPVMVEETIHEAASRVATLPVKEVFDWRRLFVQGLVVGVVTVGMAVVAIGGAVLYTSANSQGTSGASELGHGAAYWADRDLQLKHKNWPRRAHVLVIAPDPEEEVKVGQNQTPPVIRARAFRWVVADEGAYMSWRPMTWDDLAKDKDLLGGPRPEVELPADWTPRFPGGLTIDEIEVNLDKPETHRSLSPEAHKALRGMLTQLEERFASGAISRRTARMLNLPESLTLQYKGQNIKSDLTLKAVADREYTGVIGQDLKESVDFTVRGDNFYTQPQHIEVVPPPSLIRMTRDEARPAYRYVRGRAENLMDKKLVFRELSVGLFGGEKSEISVPAGSDVTIKATADKDLQPNGAHIMPPRKGVPEVKAPVTVINDDQDRPRLFVAEFKNVRTTLDFFFEFTDTDNVTSTRHVVIKPAEDMPPEFDDLAVEYLRKTAQGYMVTPRAEIPFSGKVKDDVALSSIEFAYTLSRADAPSDSGLNALFLLLGGAARGAFSRDPKPAPEASKGIQRAAIPGFEDRLHRMRDEYMPYLQFKYLLETPAKQRRAEDRNIDVSNRDLYKLHKFEVDERDSWFDLDPMAATRPGLAGRAHLPTSLLAREGEPQLRWRMQLWVEATDNNILPNAANRDPLSGRQRGRSKDTFSFLIVSEEELLAEVGKEEENLHVKLDDVLRRLEEGEKRISGDRLALGAPQFKDDQYGAISLRTEDIRQMLEKAQGDTATVYADYQRILKELKANRIQTRGMIEKVEKDIVENLRIAVEKEFGEASTAVQEFRDTLDAKQANAAAKRAAAVKAGEKAQAEVNKVKRRLEEVARHMESLTNINKLIKMLAAIQEEQIRQAIILEGVKKSLVDQILKGLEGDEPKK